MFSTGRFGEKKSFNGELRGSEMYQIPNEFSIEGVVGSQYELIPYTGLANDGTRVRVKVLSQTN